MRLASFVLMGLIRHKMYSKIKEFKSSREKNYYFCVLCFLLFCLLVYALSKKYKRLKRFEKCLVHVICV